MRRLALLVLLAACDGQDDGNAAQTCELACFAAEERCTADCETGSCDPYCGVGCVTYADACRDTCREGA